MPRWAAWMMFPCWFDLKVSVLAGYTIPRREFLVSTGIDGAMPSITHVQKHTIPCGARVHGSPSSFDIPSLSRHHGPDFDDAVFGEVSRVKESGASHAHGLRDVLHAALLF